MPLDPVRLKSIFALAIDAADSLTRADILNRECRGDADLRARVEALLQAHAASKFLASAPDATATSAPDFGLDATAAVPSGPTIGFSEQVAHLEASPTRPIASPSGSTIAGRYQVREMIGEGGMGTVFLAEQVRPVRRMVALKLIRAGMDSRTVLARFESERQALALMDHPHIARVFDAGATENGHPFFVMELVNGIPLTAYCDAHRLSLPDRLHLFRQICAAVQHAHQKGIIHRDLKPTNILVEEHDGQPVPKVIDFGLAKATSGVQLTEQSLFTALGSIAGTPLYMAPEQATFNAVDIDTRADIYALGVILYELLTGSTPIRKEALIDAGLDEMLRIIREDEPPTPSSRVSSLGGLSNSAVDRQVEASRLSKRIRGDLDWIVMKALAKERARRYDSAISLAHDLERFLNNQPVSAGPPTARYRIGKFIRRHRGQVIAASLILLTLVGGMVGTTAGLIAARRQAERAEAETWAKEIARLAEREQRRQSEARLLQVEKSFALLGSIFKNIDPRGLKRQGKTLLEVLGERLDEATGQLRGDSIGEPLAVARMQTILGESQLGLGSPRKAIDLFTQARATFETKFTPTHPESLRNLTLLATAYQDDGQQERALQLYRQIVREQTTQLGPNDPTTLSSQVNLASILRDLGRREEAVAILEAVYQQDVAASGPTNAHTLTLLNNLAQTQIDLGRFPAAIQLFEKWLPAMEREFGSDDPRYLLALSNLGGAYTRAGHSDRAIPLLERSLATLQVGVGATHPDTLKVKNNLAIAFGSMGQFERALPLLEAAWKASQQRPGPTHPETLGMQGSLATLYSELGQHERSFALYELTLDQYQSTLSPDHPDRYHLLEQYLSSCLQAGQFDRAIPRLREFVALSKQRDGESSPKHAKSLSMLGFALVRQRDWSGAEAAYRSALAIRDGIEPDVWTTADTRVKLGEVLLQSQRYTEAGPLLQAGFEGLSSRLAQIPPVARDRPLTAVDDLIALAEATNQPDQARLWRATRDRLAPSSPGSSPP